MKLEQIRKAELKDLKKAIKYLSDNMNTGKMTYGEVVAMSRTISIRGEELGISNKKLNEMAENYQIFGEI